MRRDSASGFSQPLHDQGEHFAMVKALRVGIDLTSIWRRSTGIFRYATEVTRHLLLLPEADVQVRYVLFFSQEIHQDFLSLQHTFEASICPLRNEFLIKQVWFPLVLPDFHLDIMHYPTFPPPYIHMSGPRIVMNFYDAGPWRYARAQTLSGRIYFRTLLTRGTQISKKIITLSSHARSEIKTILAGKDLPEIIVIPGAVHQDFSVTMDDSSRQALRDRYQLSSPFFLSVATLEPRKNLLTLLHAYLQLRLTIGEECPMLVVVGRKGWRYFDIMHSIETMGRYVCFLDHVPDKDLIALYQMAVCLVFPSLYEGFGLPVLEAMAAGCPVITTSSSSLPEVAGGAALLVNPLSVGEMASSMQVVLQDEGTRLYLSAAGRKQATNFSWEQAAYSHREVYREAAEAE